MTKFSLSGNAASMQQQPFGITQRSGPTKDSWEFHRPQITRLYKDEHLKLNEVMAIMKQDGFIATERMYKDRMKKWGLAKNIKEHEAIAILRIKSERDAVGKDTMIKKHNHTVDIERCVRHARRKGLGEISLSSASVPSYICCKTPPPEPLSQPPDGESLEIITESSITLQSDKEPSADSEESWYESRTNWSGNLVPVFKGRKAQADRMNYLLEYSTICRSPPPPSDFGIPEQLFRNISLYYAGSFYCGVWINRNRDGATAFELDSLYDPDQRNELQGHFSMASNLKANGSLVRFRLVLSKAFRLIHDILQRSHPRTLDRLFLSFLWLMHNGLSDVALLLRDYIRGMATKVTSTNDPWGRIFRLIGNLDERSLKEALVKAWQCNNDALDRGIGPFSDAGLLTRLNYRDYLSHDVIEAEKFLRLMYNEYERNSERAATQIPTIMLSLGYSTLAQCKYADTEKTGLEILARARDEPQITFNLQVDAMVLTALAQYHQDKMSLAESSMRGAIEALEGAGERHVHSLRDMSTFWRVGWVNGGVVKMLMS
ncbi:hypothetical protein BKA61DRAFT_698849 [Leptodontidium sp. MPI-SDFR-AT-0119]|nr:hypothetical protein BKA61DRAFT_698849 [Leptodontidium sp. MPI-SDFR-AT-0119]